VLVKSPKRIVGRQRTIRQGHRDVRAKALEIILLNMPEMSMKKEVFF
jgi:hypothetical protein